MAPKKHSISIRIPKALGLTAKEVADLKKGFKMTAVRIVQARRGSSSVNVINSSDINVINSGINVINAGSKKSGRKKSATKAKAKK